MTGADLDAVRAFLDDLHGDAPGLVQVCAVDDWTGLAVEADHLDVLVDYVAAADRAGRPGIYVRTTTLAEPLTAGTRGGADDALALPGLWADIDLAGPGHKPPTGAVLPPDEAAARRIVATAGLPDPTLWVHSGGGLYPWWLLVKAHPIGDDRAQIAALSEAWQHALSDAAASLGWHYGTGAGDLARVLRLPGTINRKVPGRDRPCRVIEHDGPRYTLDELYAALRAVQPPPPPPAAPVVDEPLDPVLADADAFLAGHYRPAGPFDALAEAGRWADILTPAGWTLVRVERDGAELWRRPGGTSEYSARCGRSGIPTAVVHSTDAGLPAGPGQALTMGRLFAWLHHGGDEAAAARDLLAAAADAPTATPTARNLPIRVLATIREMCAVRPAPTGPTTTDQPTGIPAPPPTTADRPAASTFAPLDLTGFLDGTHTPPTAGLLYRSDRVGLLYPGKVHWIYGEPESGKSLICQYAAAAVLLAGDAALYIDHESDLADVVERMLTFGVPADVLRQRFDYVKPELPPARDPAGFAALLARPYAIAVLDGVTEALALAGVESKDGDGVTAWARGLLRPIAAHTGAAVLAVDHVAKSAEGAAARFPINSQAKLAVTDGAAYLVDVIRSLGRGVVGEIKLRNTKDRAGAIKPHCAPGTRIRTAANVMFDSTTPGRIAVTVNAPSQVAASGPNGASARFRPTRLMERVSAVLEAHPAGMRSTDVAAAVGGKKEYIRAALDALVEEGFAAREESRRGSAVSYTNRHIRRFHEIDDLTAEGSAGGASEGQSAARAEHRDRVPLLEGGTRGTRWRSSGTTGSRDPVGPGRDPVGPGETSGPGEQTSINSTGSQDQGPGERNQDRQLALVAGPCRRCRTPTDALIQHLGLCPHCAYPNHDEEDEIA